MRRRDWLCRCNRIESSHYIPGSSPTSRQDRRRVYSWNPWGVLRASTFTDRQPKAWDSRNRSRCLRIFQTWQLKLLVSFAGRSNISFLLDLPREKKKRKPTIPSSSTESKRTRSRLGASQKTETNLKRRSVTRICALCLSELNDLNWPLWGYFRWCP